MNRNNIKNSFYNTGIIIDSEVSNNISYASPEVTAAMWKNISAKADTFGKHGELAKVQELKSLLDQGKTSEAKPVWQTIKSFLHNFADVAEIVSAFDSLLK